MSNAPAKLAVELADLRRRVTAVERGGQLARSTVRVAGENVRVPEAIGVGVEAGAKVEVVERAVSAFELSLEAMRTELDEASKFIDETGLALDGRLAEAEAGLSAAADRLAAAEEELVEVFGAVEDLGDVPAALTAAKEAAEAAQKTATAASTVAGSAQTAAGAAKTAAEAAQAAAGDAKTVAGTAERSAQSAITSASAAATAAGTAQSVAGAAQTAAGDAKTVAGTAKTAAEAAQAAAGAATTTAGAAQSAANAATTAAGAAQSAAAAATTAAANAAKILFSTAEPTGTAPFGSTWFQVNATGEVIGQWQQTASGIASTWTKRAIRSDVIANLDVGKLTAGTAIMVDAVAQKIAAGTAAFQTVDAKNIFVSGTATLHEALVEKLWAEVVRAKMVTADAFIGENAILDGTVTADKLQGNAIDGMTVTGANIQTSPEPDRGVKLTSEGLTGYDDTGAPVTHIDFATGEFSAQGAKISGDISGSSMYGGYIEAPTIASSAKLGSGANVLADPDFKGAVDESWVASGHLGDGTTNVRQTDGLNWDQSYRSYGVYPAGTYNTMRHEGSFSIDTDVMPLKRTPGTVTLSHRAFLNTATRQFVNPYRFTDRQFMEQPFQGGGASDPSLGAIRDVQPLRGDAYKTTYLTNKAVIPFKAGEPWSLRMEHAPVGEAKATIMTAAVEIVNASTGKVVWTRPLTSSELRYGTPVTGSYTPTVTESVKLRVRADYAAAAGGATRIVRDGWARQYNNGVPTTSSVSNLTGYRFNILGNLVPADGYSPGIYSTTVHPHTNALYERANLHWYVKSAQLAQVTPEKGWTLDKESGLRLFNANGAQTGAINGETNFLAGTFSTNPTGKRTEVSGDFVTWYNADNQPIKRIGPTTSETWSPSGWTNDDSGWIKVGSVVNGVTIGYHAGWSHYDDTAVPWNGLWFRRKNGQVTITGASRHTGWGNLSPVFTLPAGWGPGTTVQGTNCDVRAAGQLVTSGGGSIAMSFHALFPVAN